MLSWLFQDTQLIKFSKYHPAHFNFGFFFQSSICLHILSLLTSVLIAISMMSLFPQQLKNTVSVKKRYNSDLEIYKRIQNLNYDAKRYFSYQDTLNMSPRIAQRLFWEVSTIPLMMVLKHTVMEQVFGIYVLIKRK